ncbi:MAG TPA: hypothetical protein VH277_03600 [Gemmatimonadaceae bacterium]|nr:hypothetical protein [Gemmatimonadaceae bacterium]
MAKAVIIAPVALAMFLGCASTGTSAGGSGTPAAETLAQVRDRDEKAKIVRHFDASVDDTWKALGPAFQDLGYKGAPSTNGNERVYITPWLLLPGRLYEGEPNSSYFDCDRSPLGTPTADVYQVTFAVLAWVEADAPAGSVVRVLVNASARDRSNPSAMVACAGTGKLEAMFMQAIQRRVKIAGPPTPTP